jgi:hypothetical protein
VCGRVAQALGGVVASVRLSVPPPLEADLELRPTALGVALCHGEVIVAEARAAAVDIEPPAPPTYAEAEIASQRFRGFTSHVFPGCFVCGPERSAGDGLRIFPGPVEGRDLVAAPWVPDPSLVAEGGPVPPEFLWAALDCPGGFSFADRVEGAFLLGEIGVQLMGEVAVGERCVLVGWEIEHVGRKHRTGTALFSESGDCRGIGLATWIEVPQREGPR